jgi:DUF1009 family protein
VAAPLGLVAGAGALPREIARAAGRAGRPVVAVAFRGLTDPELGESVGETAWLHLGELEALVGALRERGVVEAVLAGKVAKSALYGDPLPHRPDALALELLAGLRDRRDGAILAALADLLETRGIRLLPQAALVPELLAGEGPLGARAPSPDEWADLRFGWRAARRLAELGAGQTAVVKDRAVLALEAVEGTDEAIRRGGRLGGPGACVVKLAGPSCDPRFDLPAVGPVTLSVLREVGVRALAVEAGRTVVLERERFREGADAAGLTVVGCPPEGPVEGADA